MLNEPVTPLAPFRKGPTAERTLVNANILSLVKIISIYYNIHRWEMKHLSIFKSFLAASTCCDVSNMYINREHVIPRSVFPLNTNINVIPFPGILNSARGNKRYVESIQDGKLVWPCHTCVNVHCPLIGVTSKNEFSPPLLYKPIIGASVLTSIIDAPELTYIVHTKVLDLSTALSWVNSSYEDLPNNIKNIFKV